MILSGHSEMSVSWEEDYSRRINPVLMTELLHSAVPVLKSVGWRVTEVTDGGCQSELPLCYASTNQHGTHQAALISLSADYTGGLALATLLRGVPLSGVHRCRDEHAASLWLAAMEVKYCRPSTGHLQAECCVPEEVKRLVQQRYFSGKRVLVTLPVAFKSNDELVAEARMKYFAQPSAQLRQSSDASRVSPLSAHKLKASARMIAGIRASSESPIIRVDKQHEQHAAGPHGELLAKRLSGVLPQLQQMVLARTKHIDEMLIAIEGLRQVVILGAGLDMRPFRLFKTLDQPVFFELDLPEMLEERSRVIAQMKSRPVVARRMLAANFKSNDVGQLLLEHPDYDPQLPTAVIYEGCSMYFTAEENRLTLQSIAQALQHPDSRLWSDWVTDSVVRGTTNKEEIRRFLEGMEELGERFVFGCDAPDTFLRCGFADTTITSVQEFLGSGDPTYSTYQFAVSATCPSVAPEA